MWVFAVPPNPCSNHRTLGAFCQYTGYRSIQNLRCISHILATGGFGVRSTPGGGGVRSTFLSLWVLSRNITAQKKSQVQEIRIGNGELVIDNGELAFLTSLRLMTGASNFPFRSVRPGYLEAI